MNYLLGSGYYHAAPQSDPFIALWADNLVKHTTTAPVRTVVLSVGGSWGQRQAYAVSAIPNLDVLDLAANLGHVHQYIGKQEPAKPHAYCGWSASIMALAVIAYNAEADFLYREQDCLCFGDYVGEMYRQLGDGKIIFGSYMQGGRHIMPCEQSLFLIRHEFIPQFVREYLAMPNDRNASMLPEHKFAHLQDSFASPVRRFTFGPGRGRPLPYDAPVWSAQKFTPAELGELRKRGMV